MSTRIQTRGTIVAEVLIFVSGRKTCAPAQLNEWDQGRVGRHASGPSWFSRSLMPFHARSMARRKACVRYFSGELMRCLVGLLGDHLSVPVAEITVGPHIR